MKFLSRERLSQHKYKTPEGYLICVDSVLARTGKQTYHRDEVFHDGDDTEIEVDRHPDEVFSEQTLASFENKPITVEHPDCDVTCENYKDYAVGFVRDVKRGTVDGQDVILGTLVIQDAKTIDEIEAGEHVELSCGYDCDIKDEENPQQRNIRGNHVALCEQGRAGNARIVDTADDMYGLVKEPTTRYFLAKFFNEKWETDDNVVVIKAKNETEAENKLKRSGIKYDSIRELTHSEYIKFARLTTVIDSTELNSAFKNIKSEVTDSMSFVTKKNTSIQDLKRVLGKLSRMYLSDPGIEAVLKELHDAGYEADVDSIRGWDKNRNVPGEQIKRYILKVIVEGKEKHILVELYADESDWKVKEINAYMTDSVADSIKDEISGAYKGWYTKIGYSADNEDALRRYRVEIMRDRDLSYVEADELLKRIDRFLPKKDAVEDETPYEEATRNLNKNVSDAEDKLWKVRLTGGIDVNNIMYVKADSEAEARRIAKKNTDEDIIDVKEYGTDMMTKRDKERILANPKRYFDSSKKSTVEDAEKMYKIYVKNAFGAYKVADWPAESKEKAVQEFLELNPRYKKIGVVEARDSITERTDKSLKTFKVQYTKDSETHIHLVKAKTVQDALKKVNDYRDLNAMTNAILQCNKDMASAKDKAVEYLACKSQLEDIVNQADPKVKEHWKTEKDDWLKAMKAKYHV